MRRTSPFIWLVLGILGVALVLLLRRHESGSIADLANNRFAQAAGLVALLVFVSVGVIGRGSFGRTIRYALIWGLILVVILVGYTYRTELEIVAQRVMAEVFPGQPAIQTDEKGDRVVINRGPRSTHFSVVVEVNNAPIEMVVDTGASVVTLTVEDARLAGIVTRRLRYVVTVSTANGIARAAPVTLDRLAIGPIEQRRVVALVAEEGMLETSLLGLNFLNSLSSFTISGNQMTLTP